MIPVGILTAAATSSFSFLLDDYPSATAAYSLRKLRAGYTGPCIRVRKNISNLESDIGFLNNVLDTATLLTFCGAETGLITTWYDQSGNANNAINLSNSDMPIIVISGVVQTLNSKPTLLLNRSWLTLTNLITDGNNLAIFSTQKATSTSLFATSLGHQILTQGPHFGFIPGQGYFISHSLNGVSRYGENSAIFPTTAIILNCLVTTALFAYTNNTLITMNITNWSPNGNNFNTIGRYTSNISYMNISEVVVYKTNQTSNRTGIVANTNTFYTIF
jgi:hypothetical protein